METKEIAALRARVLHLEAENHELRGRIVKADATLERLGWRHCDIAACNCGGYHNWNATTEAEVQ